MNALIPEKNLFDVYKSLSEQLASGQQKHGLNLIDIAVQGNEWTLLFGEKHTSPTANISKLTRLFLNAHSDMVPMNLSNEVILCHLGMLAPNMPIDLIPVVYDALAPVSQQRVSNASDLLDRIKTAEVRHELRDSKSGLRVKWNVGFDTHIGIRKSRLSQTNQDAYLYDIHKDMALLLVADGISVSSAGSGDMASNLTTQVISHLWKKHRDELLVASNDDIRDFMVNALINANYTICENARKIAEDNLNSEIPMGTTVVFAIARKDDIFIVSLGDSRVYLLTEYGPALLTGDQNLRGEKLRHRYTVDETENGFALIRYLGHFDENMKPALPVPDFRHIKALPDECLILCSDGLTDYAADSHAQMGDLLMAAISNEKSPFEACWQLTNSANRAGGGDNITIIAAKMVQTLTPLV